ncbi:unnamed protein product [Paramecium sonneborni]|uniref:Uncharacterized protein n=1 Tax=Paramecium sonneborni TaxID=65129 RepID=A0A8S1QML7_9CILI|nr:unnamed protein product [Paramecium sonneborni]CAD8115819.1 unnamed protein product [Paramecium sonneborni]
MRSKQTQTPEQIIHILRSFKSYIGKTNSMSPQTRCSTCVQTVKKETKQNSEFLLKCPILNINEQELGKEGVEKKIELLSDQIKNMQMKQEELENQHFRLSKNVKKLNLEQKLEQQERNQMIKKLDYMIEIQTKQEDNLNQIKQLIASRKII